MATYPWYCHAIRGNNFDLVPAEGRAGFNPWLNFGCVHSLDAARKFELFELRKMSNEIKSGPIRLRAWLIYGAMLAGAIGLFFLINAWGMRLETPGIAGPGREKGVAATESSGGSPLAAVKRSAEEFYA